MGFIYKNFCLEEVGEFQLTLLQLHATYGRYVRAAVRYFSPAAATLSLRQTMPTSANAALASSRRKVNTRFPPEPAPQHATKWRIKRATSYCSQSKCREAHQSEAPALSC